MGYFLGRNTIVGRKVLPLLNRGMHLSLAKIGVPYLFLAKMGVLQVHTQYRRAAVVSNFLQQYSATGFFVFLLKIRFRVLYLRRKKTTGAVLVPAVGRGITD